MRWTRGVLVAALLASAAVFLQAAPSGLRPSFPVHFGSHPTNFEISAVFVVPGERVTLGVTAGEYSLKDVDGHLLDLGPGRSDSWTAPDKPGLYRLEIEEPGGAAIQTINTFVLVPRERMIGEALNGVRIGTYPPDYRRLRNFEPPRGFIEVTKADENTPVSPHFRLRQFVHDFGGYPRYAAIDERLIVLLEELLGALNAKGIAAETLEVFSAFRSPFLCQSMGQPLNNWHSCGGAADIFVGDFNRDGKIDLRDARWFAALVDKTFADPATRRFEGGLGVYDASTTHRPYIHVDVRGFYARW